VTDTDTRAIMALLGHYAHHLDAAQFDEVAKLWTDDGQLLVFGRTIVGFDALREFFAGAVTGKHLGGVPIIDLDGDTARVQSDFAFWRGTDLALFSAGHYVDRVVRSGDGWRFASREIVIELRRRSSG
jgi:3-phenylpropionate/cinnamic acid dioxygenase small subunit